MRVGQGLNTCSCLVLLSVQIENLQEWSSLYPPALEHASCHVTLLQSQYISNDALMNELNHENQNPFNGASIGASLLAAIVQL